MPFSYSRPTTPENTCPHFRCNLCCAAIASGSPTYHAFDAFFCSSKCRDAVVFGLHSEYRTLVEQVKVADAMLEAHQKRQRVFSADTNQLTTS